MSNEQMSFERYIAEAEVSIFSMLRARLLGEHTEMECEGVTITGSNYRGVFYIRAVDTHDKRKTKAALHELSRIVSIEKFNSSLHDLERKTSEDVNKLFYGDCDTVDLLCRAANSPWGMLIVQLGICLAVLAGMVIIGICSGVLTISKFAISASLLYALFH